MNYSIIIAGGSGTRMKTDIPKQFLPVFDKPVIAYTLEAFQKNKNISGIVVVCLDGWQKVVEAISKQYGISKLMTIVEGGNNGQASIYNGLVAISKYAKENDVILIHDSIRPLVTDDIINDCILTILAKGNAVSVIPCNEVMLKCDSIESSNLQIPRDNLKRTQTPQGTFLKTFLDMHRSALKSGKTNYIATADLLLASGYKVYFSLGSEKNLKLTTPDDLDIFKALLVSRGHSNEYR